MVVKEVLNDQIFHATNKKQICCIFKPAVSFFSTCTSSLVDVVVLNAVQEYSV